MSPNWKRSWPARTREREHTVDKTKHYLYRIQPTRHEMLTEGATPEEAEIIREHFTYLERLTREGVAILVGRTLTTEQDTMGIVIFTAHSDEEARALMNADPAVSKGVMRAKLF